MLRRRVKDPRPSRLGHRLSERGELGVQTWRVDQPPQAGAGVGAEFLIQLDAGLRDAVIPVQGFDRRLGAEGGQHAHEQ